MISLRLQIITFSSMILVGLIIGGSFDFYRVLRKKISFSRVVTDVADILFSLMATLLICGSLIYINSGQIRIYSLLGVIIGLIIYYSFFTPYILTFWEKGWYIVAKIVGAIKKIGRKLG